MSQDEFNQKVIEHLIALGERLESIERMLGEESNPPTSEHACKTCNDTGEINVHMPHTLADSEDIACPDCSYSQKQPEWRPMRTAPEVHIKVKSKGASQEYFAIRNKNGRYTCSKGALLYTVEYCAHELVGWRPL